MYKTRATSIAAVLRFIRLAEKLREAAAPHLARGWTWAADLLTRAAQAETLRRLGLAGPYAANAAEDFRLRLKAARAFVRRHGKVWHHHHTYWPGAMVPRDPSAVPSSFVTVFYQDGTVEEGRQDAPQRSVCVGWSSFEPPNGFYGVEVRDLLEGRTNERVMAEVPAAFREFLAIFRGKAKAPPGLR